MINNTEIPENWGSTLSKLTFVLTIMMTIINCITLGKLVFGVLVSPLLDLLAAIKHDQNINKDDNTNSKK